ncbi:MAG: sigma-70 family RNA polymerase sigma factor [Chloroflexi bacterium]|nr:MAG: sigma-70 family RNA polymerase sigma factor [Chloroflexota bacterium]
MLQLDAWRRSLPPAALSPVNQRAADPFERLFVQEYAKVVAIAYRVLADRTAAEDVAQEVFLKFHRSFSPDSERASGWLHAAAVHSALNVLRGERRRARRESAHALDPVQTSIANPEKVIEEAEGRREVRRALRKLAPRTAALLMLRHSGLSYAEVATALGIKVGNVGTLLRRAEDALRKEVNRATSE